MNINEIITQLFLELAAQCKEKGILFEYRFVKVESHFEHGNLIVTATYVPIAR